MQLTKSNILKHGQLIIAPVPEDHCECLFVFQSFRFFFSRRGNHYSPEKLTDSDNKGLPDYVLNILHKIVVAHAIFVDVLGLKDIFQEGKFYQKGVRYLDIYLDNIPIEGGLASALIYLTNEPIILISEKDFQGKSLKLTLHRALQEKTLTPIHELFHLFQYAITPFNNMWFMEGLARWAQRLMTFSTPKEENLPTDRYSLESTLKKWHDAEFFWNRLDRLCRNDIDMVWPNELTECGLNINTQVASGNFISTFLKHCQIQTQSLVQEQISRQLSLDNEWSRLEKRSANNNPYIFRAILNAVKDLNPKPNPELHDFLVLLKSYAYPTPSCFAEQEVQSLMRLLKKLKIGKVFQQNNGLLASDYFDPMTGSLSLTKLSLQEKYLADRDLWSLLPIRNLIGTLEVTDFHSSIILTGLDNLESIEGNLIIAHTNIRHLNGLNQLERIKGKIEISNNPLLQTINGFNSTYTVDNDIIISDNPQLNVINGFNSLYEIKKGTLTITNSSSLTKINGFSNLAKVRGIAFSQLGLSDIDFLTNLFRSQPHFDGSIKITTCKLARLDGLANLVSTTSSLYLHGNKLQNLHGLESLIEVGASLSLSSNKLTDITQLHNLTQVHGMLGLAYNRLKTLDGLQNLKLLKTIKWNQQIRTLILQNNPDLTDISALSNIETPDRHMIIYIDNYQQYRTLPKNNSPFYKNRLEIYDKDSGKLLSTRFPTDSHTDNKINILFPSMGPMWTSNISKNIYCNANILDFKEVDIVISHCEDHNINIILPTTIPAIKFLQENRLEMFHAGIKFIIPSHNSLNKIQNKEQFYRTMFNYGLSEYIPEIYDSPEHIKYPCIKKSAVNSGGKGQKIIYNNKELQVGPEKSIISEYIKGNTEYATNILFINNEIYHHITFEKTTTQDYYILGIGNHTYNKVKSKQTPTLFLDIFKKILTFFRYEGFCCFDYKVVNNIPKIFEINARLGYTNTLFNEALSDSIQAYYRAACEFNPYFISKNYYPNNIVILIKRHDQCTDIERKIFENYAVKARGSNPKNLKSIIKKCIYMAFAYHDDNIIGIAGLKLVPKSISWERAKCLEDRKDHPYEIGFLYVRSKYREKGINRSLIDNLLSLIDNKNVFLITRKDNSAVINSFLKRNFIIAGSPYGAAEWTLLKSNY